MVTVAPNPPPPSPPPGPKLESLTRIDISTFSQSELHALSLCSDAAFDLTRTDDLVIPALDHSLFNESAGTRRQTYSRPGRAVPGRRPRLSGIHHLDEPPPSGDHQLVENKAIVNFLKQFLDGEQNSAQISRKSGLQLVVYDQLDQQLIEPQRAGNAVAPNQEKAIEVHFSERKRKRGKVNQFNVEEQKVAPIQMKILKQNGVAVDLVALLNGDEIYSEEIQRRTGVLGSEEQGLGFLGGLEGQWCSRRKKRRIVDASEFGGSLPIGWKLLLAIKKREGSVWVHCRRYISPTGQHFESCKEVVSYLQSSFGYNIAHPSSDQRIDCIEQTTSASCSGFANNADHAKEGIISNSTMSHPQENAIIPIQTENLAEVQVQDLFECYKCNMRFDERDVYFDHLLAVHQKTTRRYRLGTSVGEGVIIKDGKYECQFCHKAFEERKSYSGHVGNHIKKYVRNAKELAGLIPVPKNSLKSPPPDKLTSRISKMDALVEIAQNSMTGTPRSGLNDKSSGRFPPKKQKVKKVKECVPERAPNEEVSLHDRGNINVVSTIPLKNQLIHEVDMCGHIEVDVRDVKSNPDVATVSAKETVKEKDIVKEDVIHVETRDTPMQSLPPPPGFTTVQNKKLENVTRFEELRLDKIKPYKYSAVNLQTPPHLVKKNIKEEGSKLESGGATRIAGGVKHQLTAVCVWCRKEFKHEAIDLESQSDSIGFMCPSCKSKISGHLDSGLSLTSQR